MIKFECGVLFAGRVDNSVAAAQPKRLSKQLLLAATALTFSAPGVAYAQALPAGCVDGNNNVAEDGETATCLAPPDPIDAISTTVSDLTINVGDANTPTNVSNAAGSAIAMSGGGSQTLTINNTASTVTGSDRGVDLLVNPAGVDLTLVSEGSITGDARGVNAVNYGSGATSITVTDVASASGDGVYARTGPNATGLSITSTGSITAGERGVRVNHAGEGVLSINLADVSNSGYDEGIRAVTGPLGEGVDISVTGLLDVGGTGIELSHGGSGAVTINVAGIQTNYGPGINVAAFADTEGLSITATGDIVAGQIAYSGGKGVGVLHFGGGDLTINVAGVVAGDDSGITFSTGIDAVDAVLTATGSIYGFEFGVDGVHRGDGDVTISVVDITAQDGSAIDVDNDSTAGGVATISASGELIGSERGIRVDSTSAGATMISLGAAAPVTGVAQEGILASSTDAASTITVQGAGGAVTGGTTGVELTSAGGDITVQGLGAITSQDGFGVNVDSNGGAVLLSNNGGISATGRDGVQVFSGGGDITVQGLGAVVAAGNNQGIDLTSQNGDIVIDDVASISVAGSRSLDASSGSGAITVSNLGDVIGGVDLTANDIGAAAGDGDITLSDVNSISQNSLFTDALEVFSRGGDVTIANIGEVVSENSDAFDLSTSGGDITVDGVGTISSGRRAIRISSNGGDISIQGVGTTGGVTSASGDGITAFSAAGAIDIGGETAIGDVTGSDNGVYAVNDATSVGGISITTAGAISGVNSGVRAVNLGTGTTSITLGGAVTGGTYGVYATGANGVTLTLNSGGDITGGVFLNDGDDVVNEAGGSFDAALGGAGVDTVNFNGPGRVVGGSGGASDAIQEFEIFNFNVGGFDLAGSHVGLTETNFLSETNTLSGTLESASVTIGSGAVLNAVDGAVLTGLLVNNGVLDIGDSPGTFTINGDFTQTTTGVLPIEISDAASDQLIVAGNVSLAGELAVSVVGPLSAGQSVRTIIDGAGLSGAFDSVTGGGLLISHAASQDAAAGDVILTTTVNTASSIGNLNDNQAAIGDNLVALLSDSDTDADLLAVIASIGAIADGDQLADVLNGLGPEGLDAGLRAFTTSQHRFLDLVFGQSGRNAGPVAPTRVASLSGGPVSSGGDGGVHVWVSAQSASLDQSGGAQHVGFDGDLFQFAGGVGGFNLGPVTFGVAGGYSDFSGDADELTAETDNTFYHIAVSGAAKLDLGALNGSLSTVVSYAGGDNELAVSTVDPVAMQPALRSGEADVSSFDAGVRLSLEGVNGKAWFVQPLIFGGLNVYSQDAVTIGDGASAVNVDEIDNTRGYVGVGAAVDRQVGRSVRLGISVTGIQYFGDTQNIFSSRFTGAPANGSAFQTFGADVEQQVQFSADFAYEHKSGFVFSAGGFGEVGDLNLYGGRLGVSKRF